MFEVQPVAIDNLEELKLPTRKKLSSPCSRCLPLSSPPCLDDTLHLCLDLLVHIPPMFCMLQALCLLDTCVLSCRFFGSDETGKLGGWTNIVTSSLALFKFDLAREDDSLES